MKKVKGPALRFAIGRATRHPPFSKYKAKVSLNESGRVHISFREKAEREFGTQYLAFSLPHKKARQLADAINAVSWGDAEPIEFAIEESALAKT